MNFEFCFGEDPFAEPKVLPKGRTAKAPSPHLLLREERAADERASYTLVCSFTQIKKMHWQQHDVNCTVQHDIAQPKLEKLDFQNTKWFLNTKNGWAPEEPGESSRQWRIMYLSSVTIQKHGNTTSYRHCPGYRTLCE